MTDNDRSLVELRALRSQLHRVSVLLLAVLILVVMVAAGVFDFLDRLGATRLGRMFVSR